MAGPEKNMPEGSGSPDIKPAVTETSVKPGVPQEGSLVSQAPNRFPYEIFEGYDPNKESSYITRRVRTKIGGRDVEYDYLIDPEGATKNPETGQIDLSTGRVVARIAALAGAQDLASKDPRQDPEMLAKIADALFDGDLDKAKLFAGDSRLGARQIFDDTVRKLRRAESQRANQDKESPVRGMTAEEVAIFAANKVSVEQLKEFENRPDFREQVDRQLKIFRSQGTPLTPEQKAQKEREEKEKKIQELEKLQTETANMPENTEDEKVLKELRQRRIDKELGDLRGGGGGGERPRTAEGSPERSDKSIEALASPEKGRQIIEEIVKWEALRSAGKLNQVDWKRLDYLYVQHEIHIEAVRLVSFRTGRSEAKQSKQTVQEFRNVNTEAFNSVTRSAGELISDFEEIPEKNNEFWEEFNPELDVYLKEAKDAGLLTNLESALTAAWREARIGIGRGQDPNEILHEVEQKIQGALKTTVDLYLGKQRTDHNIHRLAFVDPRTGRFVKDPYTGRIRGIWDLYAQLARGRFADAITSGDKEGLMQRDYRDNEFHLGQEVDDSGPKETFWRLQHGWYIEVYAQTEEEFLIAADSYISRLEALTSDAKKITQEASQFIDVLGKSEGAKKLILENPDFINELIWGIEARVGVFGADDANERYNAEDYKAFLDFINKDGKGPDRFLTLLKMLDGRTAAALWKLDKDPRYELLFALYGSRGQLAHMSVAQRDRSGHGLFNQTYNLLIEEMLGVHFKNNGDLGELSKFMPDGEFTSYYDGLYEYDSRQLTNYGDANISISDETIKEQLELRAQRLERIQQDLAARRPLSEADQVFFDKAQGDADLTPLQKRTQRIQRINKALIDGGEISREDLDFYRKADEDRDLPANLRSMRRLGKIQLQLQGFQQKIRRNVALVVGNGERKGKPFDPLKDKLVDLLEGDSDARFYKNAWAEAKKAVDMAFQIYGTLGEKSKRAGGVFKTAEKADAEGKKYRYFIPIHWAEKWVQCAETLTKMQYANLSAKERATKVQQARDNNIAILQRDGYEAKMVDANGNVMKMKVPDEGTKDANGTYQPKEIEVDFYTATHTPYADWSGHTYWSYQEEHRSLLLSPLSFTQARLIREGKMRWQDALPEAVQLLILEPTLRRVKRFEEGFEDRERKLVMAAVEDSYQSHWRITRELYRAFWPKYGTPTKDIGIYYGLQDYGGFRKTIESMRARIAEDPDRFARRGRRLLPDLHNPVSSYPEYLGQGTMGALGAFRMMGTPVYRLAGTFAFDKFGANAEVGGRVAGATVGTRNREGLYQEGTLLKPTNNSDKLRKLIQEVMQKLPRDLLLQEVGQGNWNSPDIASSEDVPSLQLQYAYALMESLGRLQAYEQLLTVMESDVRNATGAFWLEGVDVLTDVGALSAEIEAQLEALPQINWTRITEGNDLTRDQDHSGEDLTTFLTAAYGIARANEDRWNGSFNETELDESKSPNTGSGRHSAKIFHQAFGEWLVDLALRGGKKTYEGEEIPYRRIFDKMLYWVADSDPKSRTGKKLVVGETFWDFVFGKFVPT